MSASPRRICLRSTPGRLAATRRPGPVRSTDRSWTWMLRTRTSSPAGSARSRSFSPIEPDQSVPVTTVPMPRRLKTRSTKMRLGARALGRVDHEQEEVDPGGAGDHGPDEALVPRHVDDRQAPPVGEVERRVAELDRDPTNLLLGEPIRVLSGQCPNEPRLSVVDVPRRAEA